MNPSLQIRLCFVNALLWSATALSPAVGCTVFNITGEEGTIAGGNEDWTNDRFELWIRPPQGRAPGMVVWGVDDAEKYPFAGFNDQGLFFDLASARPARPPRADPAKETHENTSYVRMLANCATATDAIEFLGRFNVAGLARHHVMVVDRSGASAVIEGGPQGQVVLRKQGRYQVMENFPLSTASVPPSTADRYAMADRMLGGMAVPSLDRVREVLRATLNDSPRYPTVLSYVVDLSSLRFQFYYRGNFDRWIEGDAKGETAKGETRFRLADRLSARPKQAAE